MTGIIITPKAPERDPKDDTERRRLIVEEQRLEEERRHHEAEEQLRREELANGKRTTLVAGLGSPAISGVIAAVGSVIGASLRTNQTNRSDSYEPLQATFDNNQPSRNPVARSESQQNPVIPASNTDGRCIDVVLRLKKLTEESKILWTVVLKEHQHQETDVDGILQAAIICEYKTKYKSQNLRIQRSIKGGRASFNLIVVDAGGTPMFHFPSSDSLATLFHTVDRRFSFFNLDSLLDELLS